MEDNLKKFIDDNRAEFDNEAPLPKTWQQLQGRLQSKPVSQVKRFRWQWAAAAVFILAIATAIFYLVPKKQAVEITSVSTKDSIAPKADTLQRPLAENKIDTVINKKRNAETVLTKLNQAVNKKLLANADNEYSRLLFHYASLTKAKQKQVGEMKDIDPELSVDFKKATDDLDALFLQLRDELPSSVDKEKVLKMMVENLQMQESILKKQLQLINKVQPANKKENDAYDNI